MMTTVVVDFIIIASDSDQLRLRVDRLRLIIDRLRLIVNRIIEFDNLTLISVAIEKIDCSNKYCSD